MTPTELQDLSTAERDFALGLRARLRAAETLDFTESARLAAARARAVAAVSPAGFSPAWGWLAAPALVAAVMFSWQQFRPAPVSAPADAQVAVNASAPVALDWVSDEAGPDFYRDLEFYEWLQSRSQLKPNA